ncbi:MAG: phospholipid carrier-dependent glycosyltransferase [Chloroflexota bacterium]
MTGPDSGGLERGTGAPARATGTQGAVGAILVVLALGLALRLIIAYLLPGSGFENDLASFRGWAANLAEEGPYGFYERDFFHDYTPGYLYVLWLVGLVGGALGGIGDLIKVPPVLADLAIGWLSWSMVRELGGRDRLALVAALVAVLNPIGWFDSVAWGQVDSFGVVFLLLALRELWRDRPERAAILTVVAAIIKPQLGILVPLVAVVTIRRALWPLVSPSRGEGAGRSGRVGLRERLRAWEARTGTPWRILTTGLAGYLTAVVICLPFGLTVLELTPQAPFIGSGLVEQIALAGGGYPYLSVNAYNAWALVPGDLGHSLANAGGWVCDAALEAPGQCGWGVAVFGAIPAVVVGAALLVATMGLILWVVARKPDRLTLLVGLALLALAFYMVPTRVHERYGFPFFALGTILFAISTRWRVAYVVLTAATFANMYVVLTTLYPDNPSIADWLGIGEAIRSPIGVTLVAVAHTLAFGWALLQLRTAARERLEDELVAAGSPAAPDPRPAAHVTFPPATVPPAPAQPAAPGPPTPAAMPTWSERRSFAEAGIGGWFRDRLHKAPFRADRSRTLVGERGGRLDRLDVWILIVLFAATLGMRTFRLAEPYQMHFDEVYHARTATEFLQSWRYGESHDIYEWTHPHLAKYAMAAGIALWGEDHVSATSDLGVPIRAAAHEPRRDDAILDERAGERLHVATGDEVRTYDLRTRVLVGVIPAPGVSALAVDGSADQLLVGFDDGTIATLDLIAIGLGGAEAGPELAPLATLDHPIRHLLAAADGTSILAASTDRLTAIDPSEGRVLGSLPLAGIADLAAAGTGPALLATPDAIEDAAAVAATLAELLDGDAADYEAALLQPVGAAGQVVVGSPGSGDTRTAVQEAIDDGRLAGIEIADVPRVAVATEAGVTFIDPMTTGVSSTIELDGGAHGLAMVTGIDDSQLYVTSGPPDAPEYTRISAGGDSAAEGPRRLGSHPLPGPGTRVAYDAATQQVHVLGRPGEGWTVYVIEPHANAVYADAALPPGFTPAAWVMDVEPRYVSEDRQQLVVLGSDGAAASIQIGSHAFAWRLPGVIAGALMAMCLYLLARILFQRRLVAGLVAVFVVLDGMLFVQSRIAMNDVYVALFIVAAYTLFAAVWTGWWRSRAAPWLAMPVVGVLLGLALASKWVAAYAIGALALLLLVRSALGRVLAILGLIAITGVLGYMAISVPEGQGVGNLVFLALMIALTLVAVVAAVAHPIAWTDEEQWFALLAPAAAGVGVFFGALALGALDTVIELGPVSVTPLLTAFALSAGSLVVAAVLTVAGRAGYGPMATPPAADDPRRILEPPAAPPDGWLRPGWLVGLPVVWATVCLVAIPLAVYVVSYLPWAVIENHQLWPGMPPDNSGQTLLELTGQMYGYHNGLTAPHAASSPWWAWPFDLKPVWFYQDSFAGGTTAAIYDAGNLVIWWMGVPAMAFAAVMAYRRRSLALALITIGFAAQWVPWARIDRAAFQYHYYTALPFVILALAYFVAELWHGASRRTWLIARVAAAAAIIAPAAMWVLSRPLCAFVGVEGVNPGSAACPAVIPDLLVTVRSLGLLIVVAIGAILLGRAVLALGRETDDDGGVTAPGVLRTFIVPALGVAIGFAVAALLPDTEIVTLNGVPVEPIAVVVALPLAYFAAQVLAARDAHRFVTGLIVAAVAWFGIAYPNIAAVPLPSTMVNTYQGILPTYLYAFQFPVSTAERGVPSPFLSPTLVILTVAIGLTCLVVAYSASVWRIALAESAEAEAADGSSVDRAGDTDRVGGA